MGDINMQTSSMHLYIFVVHSNRIVYVLLTFQGAVGKKHILKCHWILRNHVHFKLFYH